MFNFFIDLTIVNINYFFDMHFIKVFSPNNFKKGVSDLLSYEKVLINQMIFLYRH